MKVLLKYSPHIIFGIFTLAITVQSKALKAEGEPCECTGNFENCICRTRSDCLALSEEEDVSYCNRKKGIICCPQEPDHIIYIPPNLPSEQACARFANMTSKECSRKFITGGDFATPKEFPPAALIGHYTPETTKYIWICGGSLISERFVLTASHCAKSSTINMVRLGDLDVSSTKDDVGLQQYSVIRTISHQSYDRSEYYDIMLLELNDTVTFTDYVQPACILTPNLTVFNTGEFWAVGWGAYDSTGKMSSQLRRVRIKQLYDCGPLAIEAHNFVRGFRDRTQFCLHGKTNDTCKGDSGGPLLLTFPHYMEQYRCLYMVAGIVSRGQEECGSQDSPSINTNVTAFVRFIEFHVWPNKN